MAGVISVSASVPLVLVLRARKGRENKIEPYPPRRISEQMMDGELNNLELEDTEICPGCVLRCFVHIHRPPYHATGVPVTSPSHASPTLELMVKVSPPTCQRVFEKVKQGQRGQEAHLGWPGGHDTCQCAPVSNMHNLHRQQDITTQYK